MTIGTVGVIGVITIGTVGVIGVITVGTIGVTGVITVGTTCTTGVITTGAALVTSWRSCVLYAPLPSVPVPDKVLFVTLPGAWILPAIPVNVLFGEMPRVVALLLAVCWLKKLNRIPAI